ncbi:pentatricopeptide repeat-containing protein At5g48730, chloroplastic-like [Silene latifolia]|uniref:pentatricopeptide repeat-containing protein At5g48730, chloroplastic-like n=1 Tax=Silene latifolia TaxID=37657 RepID=UPI003D787790
MASLQGPTFPFPPIPNHRSTPTRTSLTTPRSKPTTRPDPFPEPSNPNPDPSPSSSSSITLSNTQKRWGLSLEKNNSQEAKERKQVINTKIASKKAISVILRREATKAVIEKKKGISSKRLLPRTVLEALHERITALRWESALKVFELLREQLWYRPDSGIYVKLIVMLGKCKQPQKAQELFQAMVDEGCFINHEVYTALLSAYSRSGQFNEAFTLLEYMKNNPNCRPDVYTYSILIKSCLQVSAFDKVSMLLSDMVSQGIKPSTVTYNTLIDAYGKSGKFAEMESVLAEMLCKRHCEPDSWTMNSTLRAFGTTGQIEMMEKCYEKFLAAGIEPNIKTFNILLDSYGKIGDYEKMSSVMQYMQKYHFSWTLVTYSYNVVIDAFGRAGDLKQMEFLFRLMKSEKIKPNCVTFCSLVRAYGRAGKPEKIDSILRIIENTDVTLDTVFFNCLVDAYGRMERFAEMKEDVEMMKSKGCNPDRVTYKSMIKVYSIAGMSTQAKELQNFVRFSEDSKDRG